MYAFVGSSPPTSAWLDNLETAFEDKLFVAQLKLLAQEAEVAVVARARAITTKRGKGFVPLVEAGKEGGADKQ